MRSGSGKRWQRSCPFPLVRRRSDIPPGADMLSHEQRSDRAQGRRSRFPEENWSEAETLERIGSEVAINLPGFGRIDVL